MGKKFNELFTINNQGIYNGLAEKLNETEDLTGVYKALFAYIIKNANDKLRDYIENPDLQYLEGTDNGTSITYKLSDAGKEAFLKRIIEEKKRVYERWSKKKNSGNVDENSINKAIDEFKKQIKVTWNAEVNVTDYIESVKKKITLGTSKGKIIDWLFGSASDNTEESSPARSGSTAATTPARSGSRSTNATTPASSGSGSTAATTPTSSGSGSTDATTPASSGSGSTEEVTPDVSQRIEIVNLFVDYCRSRCLKTPKCNKDRAKNIIEALNKSQSFLDPPTKKILEAHKEKVGSKTFYDTLKKFLEKKLNQKNEATNNKIGVLLKGTYITFDVQRKKVINPALKEYLNGIIYENGIADLERARNLSFDEGIEVKEVNALLVDLLREAQKIVQKLPLTFKNGKPNFLNGKKVQLFVLEQVDTLNKQRSGKIPLNASQKTEDVDLNRPLVEIGDKKVDFLHEAKDAFFILDRDNPNMAYHVKKKNGGSNEHVDIDFKNRKIGNNTTQNFFNELRESISTLISGRLDWQALYEIDSSKTEDYVTTHLIWKTSGGGGHGIGRADDVDDDQYLWEYCGPKIYSDLGEIIGLKGARKNNGKTEDEDINAIFDIKDYPKKVSYSTIQYNNNTYIQVNTPYTLVYRAGEQDKSDVKIPLGDDAGKILDIFQFKYYRKINANNKVLKSEGGRNRPRKEDIPDLEGNNIPLNPPICFQSRENYQNFRAFKKERGVIKNKGKKLFQSRGPRKDAGTTMKVIKENVRNDVKEKLPENRLPATKLAQVIIDKGNSKALDDWRALKGTEASELPTDQEWCHLRGHGDGGAEKLGNFVSGSFHCNTEQLAIEMGQRITTHAGSDGDYKLRSTAYLLKDDSMEISKYDDYKAMYGKLNENGTKNSSKDGDTDIKKTGAPVASFIRYKVYRKTEEVSGGGRKKQITTKILDYTFEGQSEFFDKNQYKILNYTVRFLLAGKKEFDTWYKEKKATLEKVEFSGSKRKRVSKSQSRSPSGSPSGSPDRKKGRK